MTTPVKKWSEVSGQAALLLSGGLAPSQVPRCIQGTMAAPRFRLVNYES
jgi:hypothetical protein